MTASQSQIGGTHYADMAIQPWAALESWMSAEQFSGYLLGSAISYLARFNVVGVEGRGGITDLRKARHYLDRLIELEDARK